MDTAERIVEAYCRYIKGWATIPNIRCGGQKEIDLLAVDPASGERYHIEVSISISDAFSKLTDKPFDPADLRDRVKQPGARRTVGFFASRKFDDADVVAKLAEYGFASGGYRKAIVTWGWQKGVQERAHEFGIELLDFRQLILDLVDYLKDQTAHFGDDTIRTLHLYARAAKAKKPSG
ncbi:MAG: hypothetical protein FJX74_23320 [Armatimonadetes bacterium]|nr:hypothetical protein [Armatimonadota bacterium]